MPHTDPAINDSFEYKGHWWLPEKPGNKLAGILKHTEEATTLELFGSLKRMDWGSGEAPDPTPIILGELENGTGCTLYKPFYKSVSNPIGPGPNSSVWSVPIFFIGNAHFTKAEELEFKEMSMSYTSLENWMGEFTFTPPKQQRKGKRLTRVKMEYVYPKVIRISIPSVGVLKSGYLLHSDMGFAKRTQEHVAYLTLTPDRLKNLDWFLNEFRRCQNLLTLFVGEPVYPKRILATAEAILENGRTQDEDIRIYPHLWKQKDQAAIHRKTMLLSMPKLKGRLSKVIKKWFAKAEVLKDVCSLFFSTFFNPGTFVEADFLTLMQTIESYSRTRPGGFYVSKQKYKQIHSAMTAAIPRGIRQDLKECLTSHISFANQHSLKRRVQAILASLETETVRLICPDPDQFKKKIVDTRNYLAHMDKASKTKALDGAGYWDANQRLILLLTILLFKELGLTEAFIRATVTHHSRWMFKILEYFSRPL